MKLMKKKGKGGANTKFKSEKVESFFNFFNPPTIPEDDELDPEEDEELQEVCLRITSISLVNNLLDSYRFIYEGHSVLQLDRRFVISISRFHCILRASSMWT